MCRIKRTYGDLGSIFFRQSRATQTSGLPDGSKIGIGFVVLTGVHPEAHKKWRRGMTFATPADVDNAFALTLIQSLLTKENRYEHSCDLRCPTSAFDRG